MTSAQNIFKKIKYFLDKTWQYAKQHKIKSSVVLIIILIAVFFGYKYFFANKTAETRYILTSVKKGTITTTISGTGQVESAEEKTIKAKSSGAITYLNSNVKVGNSISKGTLIATIDTTDYERAVENAKDNLETAKITLDDLIGADESNPKVKQDAQDDLSKAYEDGYNTVSSTFLDLPSIMKNLDSILYGNTFNNYQTNIDYYTYGAYGYNEEVMDYKNAADKSYESARTAYNQNFSDYKTSSIYSDTDQIDSLISQTYDTSKLIAQAIKDAVNLIQFYQDTLTTYSIPITNTADTHISNLSSYLSKANSSVSNLFSAKSNIKNNIDAVENSTDQIRTAKLNVKSKEQALEDANENLHNCYIYSTLSGVISAVNVKHGDDASSGTSIATIITKSKIASITLSETDIAKIKTGNKAKLTFDAIEDYTVEGEVSQVDIAGSASSGVVSYGLEIAFDTDSENVKSGMSVSAVITTNSKEDVLILPTTAVNSDNMGNYYVKMLGEVYDLTDRSIAIKGVASATEPTRESITVGLSDDSNTEITGGLQEGDQVVLRVSSSTTTSSGSSSSSSKTSSTGDTMRMMNVGGGAPPGM